MNRAAAAVGILAVLAGAVGFAFLNGAEHVTLRLGFATFRSVPLPYVVFAALIVGMLVMFAAGIHADLRVRRILLDRLAEEDREERAFYDRNQQELWDQPAPVEAREPLGPEAPEDPAEPAEPAERAEPDEPAEAGEPREPEPRDQDLTLPGID